MARADKVGMRGMGTTRCVRKNDKMGLGFVWPPAWVFLFTASEISGVYRGMIIDQSFIYD